ncbi:protein-disulfide reductase DsbD family protein [Jannaschia ovalis]|uniref:Protein-disulfide reductase DsbD family protein n=1 Tax=Jannaschia ovalis TaxID=3038773 RepID=A0ABY8LE14_9RHOB|nr:protein-disulfide reductase DsbD domain-containing protein [Jannaschia sp. GRR-S6-38]WGH79549.1 protein-disulfide reductase DsbD family protein [Jannaschia sp. GRR-S6-38]
MIRLALLLLALLGTPAMAAVSPPAEGNAVTGRLVTASDGVSGRLLSAGLALDLAEGWKTYWRSPGEVGLPPDLDWSASENVAGVELAYPAPERFVAFEIQNFGYGEEVVFPLTIRVSDPDAPVRLDLTANLLLCAEICVPETLALSLDLPPGGGVDATSAALLSDWVARVPGGAETGIALQSVHLDEDALTVAARSDTPFTDPDIFPEHGPYASFGAPETRLSDGGRSLWARLPVQGAGEGPLSLTVTDGDRAATLPAEFAATPPAPPQPAAGLLWMMLIAVLGGLILNVMPCVLPVLSIKLASALQARDRGLARVRAGFLASAAGVLAFFLALAGVVIGLQAAGVAVGWGIQFQQPAFLAVVIGLMVLFAASMFGFFELRLGQATLTEMGRVESRGGWGGDFATGAFAALMATPCSAPFIGTAITYALTSGPAQVVAIFAAMGAGLALPFLAVAARPGLVRRLPRPGAWMGTVRAVLGGLLLLTVLWLLSVLAGAAGLRVAAIVGGLALLLLAALALRQRALPVGLTGIAALVSAAVLVPPAPLAPVDLGQWQVFDRARIASEVAAGEVVFVNVTADWCLTCEANKRLVLDDPDVAAALDRTVAMRADWTRPDPVISDYLRDHDRFGIPFNAVYGPGAPQGIALPELLTDRLVLDALTRAGN